MRIKKHLKSVICLALAMLMVFSIVFVVNAAEENIASTGAAKTVYFRNTGKWQAVYAYVWVQGTKNDVKAWPGEAMTLHEDNIYKYTINGDYNMIIFNNGTDVRTEDRRQTEDLTLGADGEIYDYSTNAWEAYADPTPTEETNGTPGTQEPAATENPTQAGDSAKIVYCKNSAGWSNVTCYMWSDGSGNNGGWPGKSMTNIGEDIWQYEVTGDWDKVIFSNSGASQTGNLTFPGSGYIYDNSTNKWDVYDTSPITVKSTGTDLTAPQYKGTDIVLTANAVSKGGTVYYKFSVTKPTGVTDVLSTYSTANTAIWNPATAGTYTLIYEFKDEAGNENKRTLSYEVTDDSGVKEPIIKKVTPGQSQVEINKDMNISVTAAGGNVGTKLLFYKYTVKDESGKILNVPYYTKKATYSYTPKALGKFTVTVSVQNSDNSVIERVYAYESVTDPEAPTVPTLPTTPTTPTVPSDVSGDADNDGVLSVMDATQIQRYIAQLITSSEIRLDLSDYDKDGSVSVMDATAIQQKIAELS